VREGTLEARNGVRVRWNGAWHETPCYSVPPGGRLLTVEASAPVVQIQHASGRVMRRPGVKVARFLLSDGLRPTFRKVHTKLTQFQYSGDYHVAAVLGRLADTRSRAVGIACRVPPVAEHVLVHEALVTEVADDFSRNAFERFAAAIAREANLLERFGRESYLYSGREPPPALVGLVRRGLLSLSSATGPPPHIFSVENRGAADDELVAMEQPSDDQRGIPLALLGAGDYARTEIVPRLDGFVRAVVADREVQVRHSLPGAQASASRPEVPWPR
jgi:hypothetical protein